VLPQNDCATEKLLATLYSSELLVVRTWVNCRINNVIVRQQQHRRDVHVNGKDRDPTGPMGFPREWEYDHARDGHGNKMHENGN